MTYKLPEGLTIRVLFHACAVQKTHIVSWLSRSAGGAGVILLQTTGTLFFLDKIQTKHSRITVAQGREFVLC